MPTYEYVCGHCGKRAEFFQTVKEGSKRKCPECGRLKLKRQIGAGAGLLFKGSGFYITDYRSSEYKKREEKDKGGGTKGTAAETSKASTGSKSSSSGGSDSSKIESRGSDNK